MSWLLLKETFLETLAFSVFFIILLVAVFLLFIPFFILYYHDHNILAWICLGFEFFLVMYVSILIQNMD